MRTVIRWCACAVGLLVARGVLAQGVSDLPSTNTAPTPPPGSAPYSPYYPGAPLPPPPAAPRGAEARPGDAKTGDAKEPPHAGYYAGEGEGEDRAEAEPAVSGGRPPETHVVQKGDTLWDLSAHYLGSPWNWPKLWALNPSITNPHWIYPGDLVRLLAPGAPTGPATVETPTAGPPTPTAAAAPLGIFFVHEGFVEPGELKLAGTIIASKEEKTMLTAHDEGYVEFPAGPPLQIGGHYTIYQPTRELIHPITGERLGMIVEIFGELEVRSLHPNRIAKARISYGINPIERGYRVGPLRRRFDAVEPRPSRVDLDGTVVGSLRPRDMVSSLQIVFIDRGRKDGVEVGNRFSVYRQGDGYHKLLAKGAPEIDTHFPKEDIAEIIVVDTRDNLATGVMTRASKETHVGDPVHTRKGY